MVNSKLHILVGNQLAGDPAPYVPKEIVVKFRVKNQEFEKIVPEGEDLDLP